jgi:uncharacterized DUF497 family protein
MPTGFQYYFEWDAKKAASNRNKHHVGFDLAASVFNDPLMLSMPNIDHSQTEERWTTLGQAENGKLLVVIHTYQGNDTQAAMVRIISARPATKQETRNYEMNQ